MTKKDYVAIAEELRSCLEHIKSGSPQYSCVASAEVAHENICESLCSVFAQDNPNFNKAKFLDACGL